MWGGRGRGGGPGGTGGKGVPGGTLSYQPLNRIDKAASPSHLSICTSEGRSWARMLKGVVEGRGGVRGGVGVGVRVWG